MYVFNNNNCNNDNWNFTDTYSTSQETNVLWLGVVSFDSSTRVQELRGEPSIEPPTLVFVDDCVHLLSTQECCIWKLVLFLY